MSRTNRVHIEVTGELSREFPPSSSTVRPMSDFVGPVPSEHPPQDNWTPFILHYRGLSATHSDPPSMWITSTVHFLARDSIICYSALYAIARPSVSPSVCHTGGSVNKKLSYCCDSRSYCCIRSYCMQQYDQ